MTSPRSAAVTVFVMPASRAAASSMPRPTTVVGEHPTMRSTSATSSRPTISSSRFVAMLLEWVMACSASSRRVRVEPSADQVAGSWSSVSSMWKTDPSKTDVKSLCTAYNASRSSSPRSTRR
jgi:hypothetical protein